MSKIFKRGHPPIAPELKSAINRLLQKGGSPDLRAVRAKSIAVTSGKGGVGKTITATNLSIYFSKKGLSTALIDLDPLSDVATLLDLVEAEATVGEQNIELAQAELGSFAIPVFDNLDLIFPNPKLKTLERRSLLDKLYGDLPGDLNNSYDLLVFDLPAGSEFEENLVFLPFMAMVLLVTNPEPTAHAAAGAYIKQAFDIYQRLVLHVWHNRYTANTQIAFDPKDVVGNYNRNVPEELRIGSAAAVRLHDLASIPEDPALNLLRGTPTADANVLRFLTDTLLFVHEQRITLLATSVIPTRSFELIKNYLIRHKSIGNVEEYREAIGNYLKTLLETRLSKEQDPADSGKAPASSPANEIFTAEQSSRLEKFLNNVKSDPLCLRLIRTLNLLEAKLHRIEERKNPFATATAVVPDKSLDREISGLLVTISRIAEHNRLIERQGGLLLFYFALYKLFQSKTVTGLIHSLVPCKTGKSGQTLRDRNRQIRNLVEADPEYKNRYLKLLKMLHPVVSKQIANIVRALDLSALLLRNAEGTIVRSAYVKLLTNFLHDTLYSGLSVVVGFPFRSAAAAFQEGAEKILKALQESKEG